MRDDGRWDEMVRWWDDMINIFLISLFHTIFFHHLLHLIHHTIIHHLIISSHHSPQISKMRKDGGAMKYRDESGSKWDGRLWDFVNSISSHLPLPSLSLFHLIFHNLSLSSHKPNFKWDKSLLTRTSRNDSQMIAKNEKWDGKMRW